MKKIIASASLVAVGASGLHAETVGGTTRQETTKPWTVSAALRGFYDDNYATQPAGTNKHGSFGFEVSPSVGWNMPGETTYIGLSYTYGLKYYFTRPGKKQDQSHEFTAKLDHRFSNRYNVNFLDSFIYSSEPELLDQSTSTPIRTGTSALRNRAAVEFHSLLTEVLGFDVGYQNVWYDYLDNAPQKIAGSVPVSAILNRVEQAIHLDARWQLREHSVLLVGYQYGLVNYTSSKQIYSGPPRTRADVADAMSHYIYVGAEHSVSSELSFAGKVGVQLTDYDNPRQKDQVSPYVDLSGTYTYLPGDTIRLGLTHSRAATDVTGDSTNPTVDLSFTRIYGELVHRITPVVTGSLQGSYQHSEFTGGPVNIDGQAEDYFALGLNFAYKFNQYWSAETGYNWDHLVSVSALSRGFTRNRVYVGVRAAF